MWWWWWWCGGGGGGSGGGGPPGGGGAGGDPGGGPGGGGGDPGGYPDGFPPQEHNRSKWTQTPLSGPIQPQPDITIDFDPYDLFGGLIAFPVPIFDWRWNIDPEDEKRCYVRKDLDTKFTFPKWVPHNHYWCMLWFKEAIAAFEAIDVTTDMTLVEWWRVIESFPEDINEMEMIRQLDSCNSQGFILFARYLRGRMSQKCYMSDQMFGYQFSQYIIHCDNRRRSPDGRVMAAMITFRFKHRPEEARLIAVEALWRIECPDTSWATVIKFVERVRFAFMFIKVGDILDARGAFDWLYRRVKGFQPIKRWVEKIERARQTPDPATKDRLKWNYLWSCLNEAIKHRRMDVADEGFRDAHFKLVASGGMSAILDGTGNNGGKGAKGMAALLDAGGGKGDGKQNKKGADGNTDGGKKGGKGKGDGGQQKGQQQGGGGGDGKAKTPAQIDQAADEALKTKLSTMGLSALEMNKRLTQARADRAWNRASRGQGSWAHWNNALVAANAAAAKVVAKAKPAPAAAAPKVQPKANADGAAAKANGRGRGGRKGKGRGGGKGKGKGNAVRIPKKYKACKFFVAGQCNNGAKCEWSHDMAIIGPARKAAHRDLKTGRKLSGQPKAKAKAKAKVKAKAKAKTKTGGAAALEVDEDYEPWYGEDGNELPWEEDAYDNENDGTYEEYVDETPNDGTDWENTPWHWLYCTGNWEECDEIIPGAVNIVEEEEGDLSDPLILIRPGAIRVDACSGAADCILGSSNSPFP